MTKIELIERESNMIQASIETTMNYEGVVSMIHHWAGEDGVVKFPCKGNKTAFIPTSWLQAR